MCTGDSAIRDRAYRAAEAAAGRIAEQQYGQAGILAATAVLVDSSKLITVDRPGDPTFARIANAHPDPRRVDIALTIDIHHRTIELPGGVLPDLSRPGAWLCTAQFCKPFITDADELERQLRAGPAG